MQPPWDCLGNGCGRTLSRAGIGRLLLQLTLAQMQAAGYAYAVIGWVSSEDFYAKTVGAMPIPNSRPDSGKRP